MAPTTQEGRHADGSASTRPETVPASVWWIAVVLASGSVMAGLDTSLVNVGLEAIGRSLDVSLAAAQWINSGYLLALAAALPACGWLSRRIGAGRLWLWALGGFTLTSALCALAPNAAALIVARVLQGLTGGILIPSGMAILGQVAGPKRMGRVMAISSVPSILAPAIGPVVGALLIANLSWHWLFLINVPIGLIGLAAGIRMLPRGEAGQAGRLDAPALALVAAGLPLLTFTITEATQRRSVLVPTVWLPGLAAIAVLGLFVNRSLRSAEPLMDLRLARNRVFAAASTTVTFSSAALFGGLIVMPLYFQLEMGAGIVDAGLLLMAFSLGAAVTFPLAGYLTDRFGGGIITAIGLVVTVLSTVPMALLPPEPDTFVVEVLQAVRGVGLALAGSPVVAAALATVRSHQMPDASAQVNILARVGGAIGSALYVVILSNGLPPSTADPRTTTAFHTTFWWLTGTALVALAGSVWLVREQRRAGSPPS